MSAGLKILSGPAGHPTRPDWLVYEATFNGAPAVVECRVPSPDDTPVPPIQFSERDLQADPSTTWRAIVAHLTGTATGDRTNVPILGEVG